MSIPFTKMSGAGNDFIVFDDVRGGLTPLLTPEALKRICTRGTGVGADGVLILLPPRGDEAFTMRYHNADGGRAAMCGNGARCICCFARSRGFVAMDRDFTFRSDSGLHRGRVLGRNSARVWMTNPRIHFLERRMDFGLSVPVSLVDTGVPHAVVFRDSTDDGTFERHARNLREHPSLAPQGANADWAVLQPDGSVRLRTFERGVEGETLACGTGAVAVVVVLKESFPDFPLPVSVRVRSGLTLTVGFDRDAWWLAGPANVVYRGYLSRQSFLKS